MHENHTQTLQFILIQVLGAKQFKSHKNSTNTKRKSLILLSIGFVTTKSMFLIHILIKSTLIRKEQSLFTNTTGFHTTKLCA